ncbi:DUF6415 family natural product biosynthesis protein [Streptomyces sp. SYP-A7185]|uniref:DUF6415 family natural product biosynthesis protein n=1 Tax=Streptomyces sp. SYP-A7185 TaxID=3040076 RepID=UPI0038F74318
MNAAMVNPQASRREGQWMPALSVDRLRDIRDALVAWTPLDLEPIFDDLDATIGNQPPPAATVGTLVKRLRGRLKRLCDIAAAGPKPSHLIGQGRLVRGEFLPADHQQAIGLARRLAFAVGKVIEAGSTRGADDA